MTSPPRTSTSQQRFDRRIIDGPLTAAVWHLAWPAMLQNAIGGAQGMVDHAMVGHIVGFTGNAAIGVSWQIILVVIVFISSLYTGMGVLVSRYVGMGDADSGEAGGESHHPRHETQILRMHDHSNQLRPDGRHALLRVS